jgi:hypothetical protein
MTTIVTSLGCSRSELNSQRAGGYEGESRSRAAEEKLRCATPCAAITAARRGHRPRLLLRPIGHGGRGDRRHRRGRSSLARRPLWTALPRRAVYGGANGGGLIFFSFFFLGLLLFHSLISLLPHFFEVIGFRLTRFPSQPLWSFHDLSSPFVRRDKLGPKRKFLPPTTFAEGLFPGDGHGCGGSLSLCRRASSSLPASVHTQSDPIANPCNPIRRQSSPALRLIRTRDPLAEPKPPWGALS